MITPSLTCHPPNGHPPLMCHPLTCHQPPPSRVTLPLVGHNHPANCVTPPLTCHPPHGYRAAAKDWLCDQISIFCLVWFSATSVWSFVHRGQMEPRLRGFNLGISRMWIWFKRLHYVWSHRTYTWKGSATGHWVCGFPSFLWFDNFCWENDRKTR